MPICCQCYCQVTVVIPPDALIRRYMRGYIVELKRPGTFKPPAGLKSSRHNMHKTISLGKRIGIIILLCGLRISGTWCILFLGISSDRAKLIPRLRVANHAYARPSTGYPGRATVIFPVPLPRKLGLTEASIT